MNKQPSRTTPAGSNQPEATFRYGACSASVFINEATRKDGTTFEVRRVVLQRSYKDDQGRWQVTSSFDVNDLPRLILAAQDAYRHCTAARSARDPGDEG